MLHRGKLALIGLPCSGRLSAAFHKYGDAPRAARRPPGKARGASISGMLVICFTQVTPTPCGGVVGDGRPAELSVCTEPVRRQRLVGQGGKTVCPGAGKSDG